MGSPGASRNRGDATPGRRYGAGMAMHEDQLTVTTAAVERALATHAPDLAGRPLTRQSTSATTSEILRLGEDLVVRVPLRRTDPAEALSTVCAEQAAMAEFAALAPFPAPIPVRVVPATAAVPMPFAVTTWVPGTVSTPTVVQGSEAFARDLVLLLTALRSVDIGSRRFDGQGRGGTLGDHRPWVHECLDRSRGLLPVAALSALWDDLSVLPAPRDLRLCHRDLIPANVLTGGERLTGVLDTGGCAPADPALDLVVCWHLLDAPRRAIVREALACDDPEWVRGAAWAFEQAIGLVWYYATSNPTMAELGRSTLARLLEDARR